MEYIDQHTTSDDDGTTTHHISLKIKPDIFTELERTQHFQYFCFRSFVSGLGHPGESVKCVYSIVNACETSYSRAWNGYTVCYTEDSMKDTNSWRRNLDTEYEDGKLVWTHHHNKNGAVYFSYYPPYTYNQHLNVISKVASAAAVSDNNYAQQQVESVGQTLDGREIEVIKAGTGDLIAWIIHRQHPGEHMAEYFAEGLLTRLLGLDDSGQVDGLVRDVLNNYTVYIVPSMCPDGAVRGHLRTNAAGANLNREWADASITEYAAPTLENSPEVYHILKRMIDTGVDLFLDVHGDEELPYNFLSGSEGTVNWGPRLQALHGVFLNGYVRANSDMQKEFGYTPAPNGRASVNIGTNAIANRFNCFAATLEMVRHVNRV